MKADASNEQRFIADVDAFEFIAHDLGRILHSMEKWLAQLSVNLQSSRLVHAELTNRSALAKHAEAINAALQKSMLAWKQQWAHLEPAQALAETFDDKALLLVFGKFNAGKSSLCNLLADRFAAHGKSVEYFYLDAGSIVETAERFKEGVTETTARLQGVRLAGKLVLVDTPGLHSVTPDNAALTQRFTDSADGVLWLTSSTSPGQVQELDELGRELHRNKPLLPVVTRSDVYEEDEIDGEIVKLLRNKTPENRAEQEADVRTRAEEKLMSMGVAIDLLKAPVSISSYLAREQGETQTAMSDAGFDKLYAALMSIAEETLAYKRRKQAEVFLHHLEENVMSALCRDVYALLGQLRSSSDAAIAALEDQQKQIANAVWREVVPTLPALLDAHSSARDVEAIAARLSQAIFESFSREIDARLHDYAVELDASLAPLHLDDDAVFEETVAGIDYQRLHAALSKAIRDHILRLCRDAAEQCHASIARLNDSAARLQDVLRTHEADLIDLKARLRSEFN
ncbi:small GTP-binding protein [Caballeronia novacaledonica]|uniref:Small GTP-binding protein n=1 Tax=Caballeronia novacaledonica TaxID=1544861 RepID=A0A2U3I5W0_9BURK|nr:dynamin family protein [Caballeronia novacaledonica]SPB15549.1 small GTP-binding protein [Caballeronia novacaledonica]